MPIMTDHDYLWDPSDPMDPDVAELEVALRRYRYGPSAPRSTDDVDIRVGAPVAPRGDHAMVRRPAVARRAFPVRWFAAACLALAVVITANQVRARAGQPWRVVLDGAGERSGADGSAPILRPGEWLVTDEHSTARLNVGHIGKATLGPASRLQLARAGTSEHRLVLQRGELQARIWAPPRFFLVETPSATAVDLGCVYTLTVDSLGNGLLSVESGEVELTRGRSTVLVPAGNAAALRRGQGPGLPVPARAAALFRRHVAAFDAGATDRAHVAELLLAADRSHTITLWHMLDRVAYGERPLVISRLAELAPLPRSVTLEQVLRGEPRAMLAWRDTMMPGWSSEPVPVWKQSWRWLWRAVRSETPS
jgi:hypothetical protein